MDDKPNHVDNGAFSRVLPGLQLVVDSTSLGEFKLCPRRYYYSIVQGFSRSDESIDLAFGIAAHHLLERFHRRKSEGWTYEDNLRAAVVDVHYHTRNAQGGLDEIWTRDPNKNATSLMRFVVWYLDQFERDGGLETVQTPQGPAVELSFRFETGITASTGETFELAGHLDRLVAMNGHVYVADLKTTRSALGSRFASNFSPDNQFSLYSIAASTVLARPADGVILDGAQIGATFVRFQRALITRPAEVLVEWWDSLRYWLGQMDACANQAAVWPADKAEAAYPQNDKSCGVYGGCPFRDTCSRSPYSRHKALVFTHQRRRWDPTIPR